MGAMAQPIGSRPLDETRQRRPTATRAAMPPSLGGHVARVATLTETVGAKATRNAKTFSTTRGACRVRSAAFHSKERSGRPW